MSLLPLLLMPALAGTEDDVARGWYLWRTGQDEAAAALAVQTIEAAPDHLGAHRLHVAMQVVMGNGGSVEAAYKEAWGLDPDDPVARVALAFAIAQRRAEPGPWCDEVSSLVAPVVEGEPHYWATLADRQRELRCEGHADHADTELRRLAKEGGLGFADGVIAKMAAGYIKEDLPADLEKLWTDEPQRLDSAGLLWADNVGGPSRARARGIASRALSDTLDGDNPVYVHAAVVAYQAIGKDGKLEDAIARLAQLDANADPTLDRSVDNVRDPGIYFEIDACMKASSAAGALACLADIEVPESGAIAAHWHAQSWAVHDYARHPEEAYKSAKAAWQADPSHRFNARTFARAAASAEGLTDEDAALAAQAMDIVVADRVPEDVTTLRQDLREGLARDLQARASALVAAGRPADGLDDQLLALQIAPTPGRRIVLGQVLAAAERPDDAVLFLALGLATELDDKALLTEGRGLLAELEAGWHPRGLPGMLEEVVRSAEFDAPRHPLVGQAVPDEAWLPEVPEPAEAEGAEEPPPPLFVVAMWAAWSEDSLRALERVTTISAKYEERGVVAGAVGVGLEETELPEEISMPSTFVGASAMRAVRTVAVPAVFLVDEEGAVVAALAPYDRASLQLETALDALLPEEE